MPFQLSPEAGHGMPHIMGVKVFTSPWLARDQPETPIRYGAYGYLVSQNLYDQLLEKVDEDSGNQPIRRSRSR